MANEPESLRISNRSLVDLSVMPSIVRDPLHRMLVEDRVMASGFMKPLPYPKVG